MPEKILSICIPTYNRADILDKTLSDLVLEPSFQLGKIEICISDNASPDNTEGVVKKYTNKFKNIIYSRNKVNTGIIDGNFPIVGALASGTFIKFLNDYASFIPGELDKIIEFIEANKVARPVLFFPNNCLLWEKNKLIFCDSLDSFVNTASYWTTWVLAAGLWRDDFISIKDRDRSVSKYMWCPDNYLRLVSSGRKAIIYNKQFCSLRSLSSKGGYNLFQTFGINYLLLYDEYLKSGSLSKRTFNREKYRLFRYFLLGWYKTLVISKDRNFVFEKNDANKILMKNYKYEPYFYFGILVLRIRSLIGKINKMIFFNK